MRIPSLVRVSVLRPAGDLSLVLVAFFMSLWAFFGSQVLADPRLPDDTSAASEQVSSPIQATVAPDFPSSVAILSTATRVTPPETESSPRKRLTPPAATSYILPVPIDHRYPGRHFTCVLARVQRVDPAFLGCFLI